MRKLFIAALTALSLFLPGCDTHPLPSPDFHKPLTIADSHGSPDIEIKGIDELITLSPIIAEVVIEEIDTSWADIGTPRYKCLIETDFTGNLDAQSRDAGWFYFYDNYSGEWEIGENYILFLDYDIKYIWSHTAYYLSATECLWGISDEDRITLYHYDYAEISELYTCTLSEFEAFVSEHSTHTPVIPNEFISAAEAASHASDVFTFEVQGISEGVNEYTRSYHGRTIDVFKTVSGYSANEKISVLGPCRKELLPGSTVMVMYETNERGSRFMFSYDYSFTADPEHIKEVYSTN